MVVDSQQRENATNVHLITGEEGQADSVEMLKV